MSESNESREEKEEIFPENDIFESYSIVRDDQREGEMSERKKTFLLIDLINRLYSGDGRGVYVFDSEDEDEDVDYKIKRATEKEEEKKKISKDFKEFFSYTGLDIKTRDIVTEDGDMTNDTEFVLVVDDLTKFKGWLSSMNNSNFFNNNNLFRAFVRLCHELVGGVMKYLYNGNEDNDDFIATINSVSDLNSCINEKANSFTVSIKDLVARLQEMMHAIKDKYLPLYIELERSGFSKLDITNFTEKGLDYTNNYFYRIREIFNKMLERFKLEKYKDSNFSKMFDSSVSVLNSQVIYVHNHNSVSSVRDSVKSLKEWFDDFGKQIEKIKNEKR